MFIVTIWEKIYDMFFVKKNYEEKDFSALEHIPQTGDCILISANGLVSDGIKWMTKGIVSHVAIYVGGGERKIIEAIPNGVKIQQLDKYFKNCYNIYVKRIKNIKLSQAEIMKDYAYTQVDKRYDYVQFIGLAWYFIMIKLGIAALLAKIGINIDVKNPTDSVICSELYNDAANDAGIKLTKKNASVVTPQDLMESSKMETILEV